MHKVIKSLAVAVLLASSLAIAHASTSASEASPAQKGAVDNEAPRLVKSVPAAVAEAPRKSRTFRVNDEKGPLLTCIAPDIEKDANTDLFEDCALAPGRTLDDLMHTFVGAIHYEQKQHEEERAEWMRQLEDKDK